MYTAVNTAPVPKVKTTWVRNNLIYSLFFALLFCFFFICLGAGFRMSTGLLGAVLPQTSPFGFIWPAVPFCLYASGILAIVFLVLAFLKTSRAALRSAAEYTALISLLAMVVVCIIYTLHVQAVTGNAAAFFVDVIRQIFRI